MNGGGGGGQPIEVVLQLDGIQFGRVVVNAYDNETKRQGMRVRPAEVYV